MDEHVLPTYKRAEEVFLGGHGAWLVDDGGHEHLDFLAGIAVSALGHAHPGLVVALRAQAGKVLHLSNLLRNEHTEVVAERLARLSGLHSVFFCNGGSEANEAAIKFARKAQRLRGAPQRTHFVALQGGFHGRSIGALSLTSKAAYREPFQPLLEVDFVEPEDSVALERALSKQPAALFLEPIQGEGGIRPLSTVFLRRARELCDESGTLLVHDEVQCGAGRTGDFLAAQHADVTPDVVTLAKPIAGGLPLGAMVVSEALRDVFGVGEHGSTFGGGPLVLCAARVFLEELEEGGLLAAVRERGAQLEDGLEAVAGDFPIVASRRGRGLIQGLLVPGRAAVLVDALRRRLVLTCNAGPDVLRLLPPFVIRPEEIDEGLARLRAALTEISDARSLAEKPS
jgi:acetylornithine/succinyldiaminopimelate/putrescine aminotransferase